MKGISEKQKRWALTFVETGNATEAAIEAGYSKKSAKQAGWRNQNNSDVMSYVAVLMSEHNSEKVASAEEVLQFQTAVMRGEIPGSEVRDMIKASELIGKRYGIYTDNINVGSAPRVIDDV